MKRILFAALLAAQPALAHDVTVGALTVGHPMAFETPPTARSAAGYFTITNEGDAPETLVGIRSDVAGASLHESVDRDGMATMEPVERLEIPAGGSVTFEPGGYHVMFTGLEEPFREGDEIAATLVFDQAGEVAITFVVEPRGFGMGHGGMDHGEGH